MRILMVTPYPPSRDGIGDYAAALAGAFATDGHEVGVVVPRPAPADAPPEVLGALGGRGAGPALRRRIAAFAPDVVHVQFAVAAFGSRTPALLAALRAIVADTGARLVVTAHEVTRDTAILRAAGRALYRRLCAPADRVLVHTPAAAAALTGPVGAAPGGVAVVPHHRRAHPATTAGPDELRGRWGLEGARVLLAFGFVHPDKGLGDLVAALAALRRRGGRAHDDVRLVVAGTVRRRSGAFRLFEARDRLHLARVRRRIAREGLGDRVRFTGYVPEGEIAPWFALSEAVVMPYRRIEQSGVGSLAAAFGAPVVASTAGDLAEDYGDPRWTVAPGDPPGLAAALARLLATPPAGRAPAVPGRVPGADLDVVARAVLDAYGPVPSRPATLERHAEHA